MNYYYLPYKGNEKEQYRGISGFSSLKKSVKFATLPYPHSSIITEMRTDEFIKRILPLKDNLYRVAFRITGDRNLSEQIVQETMLKVWNQRAAWMVIEDLPAYCLMVTRNMALQSTCTYSGKREQFAIR